MRRTVELEGNYRRENYDYSPRFASQIFSVRVLSNIIECVSSRLRLMTRRRFRPLIFLLASRVMFSAQRSPSEPSLVAASVVFDRKNVLEARSFRSRLCSALFYAFGLTEYFSQHAYEFAAS